MRYMLFGGEMYYPEGGSYDLKANSDSLGELLTQVREKGVHDLEWFHIFDTEKQEIVAGTRIQGYEAPEELVVDDAFMVIKRRGL